MTRHLPLSEWPEADRRAWEAAFEECDLFDERGGRGAHLAPTTRQALTYAYRRWLGFLKAKYPEELLRAPAERVTSDRVRSYIENFGPSVRPSTLAIAIEKLTHALRLIAPDGDWHWLKLVSNRLAARAAPVDRFDRLVPGWRTLDYGIELMDAAIAMQQQPRKTREVQYRDGLLIALLSVWPIRRRSLAALTVTDHIERNGENTDLLLHPTDTKSGRAESFRVPAVLEPYLRRYLAEIRPCLLGERPHNGFWASYRRRPLCGEAIYERVSKLTARRFGRAMGVHDFRRSGSTYLAIEAPEKVGLIPGILQHTSPDVGDQHYNLARGAQASRRYVAFRATQKRRLRPKLPD